MLPGFPLPQCTAVPFSSLSVHMPCLCYSVWALPSLHLADSYLPPMSHFAFIKNNCVYLDCVGSSLLRGPFSCCSEWGLHSSCGLWASHCCGFSCWAPGHIGFCSYSSWAQQSRLLASRAQAQYLGHMGLAAPWDVGSSWMIEPMSLALAGGLFTPEPSRKFHVQLLGTP